MFDSDGHPVDGGDIPTPRRRIDFSPFRISSSLTYGDGQPIEVSTRTPLSRLPSFIPFSGARQPSQLDLSLMFPTPSTPKFRSPRSTPRTHSSDEAVSSVNASLGYVTPQHRAPDSSGGKTLPMLHPPQGVSSEQVSPLQDSSTPRDELFNKERPSKELRKRARSASVEPKQESLTLSSSTPMNKFTPFEIYRNIYTASKNDVVFVSGKRRRRSILRSASKSGSSLTKSVSRLANLDDIRKQLLDRSQLRREKQESKLVALNQPDHSLQDQDVLQDTEAGVNVPSTLVAGPPFLTPTPLTPQTDDELSDPQGDEETETAANVNAKFSDLRTAP